MIEIIGVQNAKKIMTIKDGSYRGHLTPHRCYLIDEDKTIIETFDVKYSGAFNRKIFNRIISIVIKRPNAKFYHVR